MSQVRGQVEGQLGVLPTDVKLKMIENAYIGGQGCEDDALGFWQMGHNLVRRKDGTKECTTCGFVVREVKTGV